jgi:hypothetical protein
MPVLIAGVLVCTLAASFIYAKGYEGGSGVAEGARFGAAIGVFVGGYAGLVYWSVLRIGRNLAITMGAVGLVEWLILGVIIGLVYKPSSTK